MKRFELSTLSLARRCSTTELHPQVSLRGVPLATWKACTTKVPLVNHQEAAQALGIAFISDPISRACKA